LENTRVENIEYIKRGDDFMYSINEDYFKTWTKNMAYITGFICADGCVMSGKRNSGVLNIALAEKDRSILNFISKEMSDNDVPVKDRICCGKKCVRIDICRRRIVEDLIQMGVVERKSKILMPINVPEEVYSHFIRGYFDGDGYIRVRNTKDTRNKNTYIYKSLECSMLGTKEFLGDIKEKFISFYGKKVGSLKSCEKWYSAHRLSFVSRSAVVFGEWIYTDVDNSFCLERKHKIYTDFITEHPKKKSNKIL
jgi:hypothetical protein